MIMDIGLDLVYYVKNTDAIYLVASYDVMIFMQEVKNCGYEAEFIGTL